MKGSWKIWRNGIMLNEGGEHMTFTMLIKPFFVYFSVRIFGKWFRVHNGH
jgi:hypothetical protein